MQSLYFTEEHELFRQSVRQFVEQEALPHIKQWELNEQIPRSVWLRMGELGFLGVNHAEEYGGSASDFFYSVVYLEELARCEAAGLGASVSVHQYMATAHIAAIGSDYLRQTYLSPAISGEKIGALGITEPGGGGDVAAIRTTAKREGDYYIVNGSKTFITNGYYADFITMACRTNPDPGAGIGGMSLIVIDCNSAGISRSKLKKMGWHSSDTAELFFDNVRVPVSNLVGEEGMGFYYVMDSFQLERLVAGILSVAGAFVALEWTVKYMHERKAFGRPIAKFQALRHEIADITTQLEAARQLTYYTAWLYQNKQFPVKECSMVKLLTSELAKKASDIFLQCFGGYGFMDEYPISRMYRDARVGTIVGGTSQIMKEIIAKVVIDDHKFSPIYDGKPAAPKTIAPTPTPDKGIPITANQSDTEADMHNSTNLLNIPPQMNPTTAREILYSLPERLKVHKLQAGYETCIHFNISGDNGGEFTVNIKDGVCTVADGLNGTAKCVITTKDSVYEGVELGKENPQMAVMMGKIKLTNISEMMTFTGLFQRLF